MHHLLNLLFNILFHIATFSLPGRGSCTSRPSTRWSLLSLSIRSNNSSSLMSECLRIVSLEIPVGGSRENSEVTSEKTHKQLIFCCSSSSYVFFSKAQNKRVYTFVNTLFFFFFSYRHQLQLVSYSGRRSDWLDCLLPEPHSDGVFCGRLEPSSPRRPGPPLESAVLVSFLRWLPPPVCEMPCKNHSSQIFWQQPV